MKPFVNLNFGFSDAENYKRRENKELFNRVFVRNQRLEELCEPSTTFLIGEKGTGKTAYAIYLANNNFKNTLASIRYIRETEYKKFLALKAERHLDLSDYTSIWKVLLYLLISQQIKDKEEINFSIGKYRAFAALDAAIQEYYLHAFSPEIISALQFVQQSKLAAELLSKHAKASGEETETLSFSESRFQTNLLYIQKSFERALSKVKLGTSHILFIDGIDIRPGAIPYPEYLECIKGLANAVWEINNDFFPSICDSKGRMRAVLLIRPDIFETLGLQNQNTKIRDNSVFLDWRTEYINHRSSELFRVTDRLLSTQQETDPAFGASWDFYFDFDAPNVVDKYDHPTSFISFLRYAYYRPRDIVTMLSILQEDLREGQSDGQVVTANDFDDAAFQRRYSNYLLGEVKDQLLFYYTQEDYDIFLKFFEFLSGQDKFTFDEYVGAFNKLMAYLRDTSIAKPKFMSSANEFLQFLFSLNVICYLDRTTDSGKKFIHWCFRDRNYSNISPKVKTGVEYQVFYGLAKALNLGKRFGK